MKVAAGDFVLPVFKPEGPTSHDVVAMARRALGTKRVGHTGTLDPFASGLLLLCVGRATRLAEYLTGLAKGYSAVARLGSSTDTLDRTGEVVDENDEWAQVSEAAISAALESFLGEIDQVPPQFSAKKVDGEAMHRRARRGERLDLEACRVTVHEVALLDVDLPDVRFSVRCGSGTYIRSFARDLGQRLGVGAHLTALCRTSVGSFSLDEALALDDLESPDMVVSAAVEPIAALAHLPSICVDDEVAQRLRHGQRVRLHAHAASPEGGLTTVSHDAGLLAIVEVDEGVLKPRKVFAT